MGVKARKKSFDECLEKLARHEANLEKALLRQLMTAGEMCVTQARLMHTYTDRTGNLTSSIGYIVAVDGQIRRTAGFQAVKDGHQGAKEGKAYARELVKRFPRGHALIIVAGMEYAAYVADKGCDVIDSAELLAQQLLPELIRKIKVKIEEK